MASDTVNSSPNNRTKSIVDKITLSVAPNKLSVSIKIPWPEDDEIHPKPEEILSLLTDRKIVFGIDQKAIDDLICNSDFDKSVIVARGIDSIPGKSVIMHYKFEKVQELNPAVDEDGRIDYKDINFIQQATKDQVLIEKTPPKAGKPGTDVFGKEISALSGKDANFPAGSNTIISSDGSKLMAGCDGSIVFVGKRININEIHTIGGNVDNQTGNIKHKGSLIIRGNVESGFAVEASGDIEISKNVADAKIICGGNVMVKGGFLGGHKGLIKAVNDVHCKYVDDQTVVAGNNVYIGGEIFNGNITAKNMISATGAKGRIVGGKLMAGDEISATCLGSDAGTRTVLQVAYNAELMNRYSTVKEELHRLEENTERVKEGLYVFYRLEMDGKLSLEQAQAFHKLKEFKKNLPDRKSSLIAQKEKLEKEIQQNQNARIIAVKKVYPGVVLHFGVVYKEITDEMGPSFFQMFNGVISREEYKPG